MSLATHCIPYNPECSLCSPPPAAPEMTPEEITAEITRARFMAELPNIPKVAVSRLDEETERLILDVDEAISSFYAIESDYEIDLAQVRVDAAFNALRLRISQSISEAEERGYADALRMGYDAAEAYAKGADTR